MKEKWVFYFGFFSSVFGCISFLEITRDNFIPSYREMSDLFLLNSNKNTVNPLFAKYHKQIDTFMKDLLANDPIELFKIIWENGNREMAHFVILTAIWSNDRLSFSGPDLSTNRASFFFFQRSKVLIRSVIRRKNWTEAKEIVAILLSLQRKFLYQLDSNEFSRLNVKRWMRQYDFIYHAFEPRNQNDLFQTFHDLHWLAKEHTALINKNEPSKFPLLKTLGLFQVHCQHFNNYYWEDLDLSTISPYLLYHVFFYNCPKRTIFRNLRHPHDYIIPDRNWYPDSFFKIIHLYEGKFGVRFGSSVKSFQRSSRFCKFLQSCLDSKENIYNLGEREKWLIEASLRIFPIFNVHFPKANKAGILPGSLTNLYSIDFCS
jgi:hypothetical protein